MRCGLPYPSGRQRNLVCRIEPRKTPRELLSGLAHTSGYARREHAYKLEFSTFARLQLVHTARAYGEAGHRIPREYSAITFLRTVAVVPGKKISAHLSRAAARGVVSLPRVALRPSYEENARETRAHSGRVRATRWSLPGGDQLDHPREARADARPSRGVGARPRPAREASAAVPSRLRSREFTAADSATHGATGEVGRDLSARRYHQKGEVHHG
jgi:hypothetical protein